METIKNEKQFIANANEMFNWHGEPQRMSKLIERMMFSYIELACLRHDCMCDIDLEIINTARSLRDLLRSIETIKKQ